LWLPILLLKIGGSQSSGWTLAVSVLKRMRLKEYNVSEGNFYFAPFMLGGFFEKAKPHQVAYL
jgi:hypothetical protein